MKCPRDGSPLETERYEADIDIDRCGSCKGVWLDDGELNRIQDTVERDHSDLEHPAPSASLAGTHRTERPDSTPLVACLACGTEMVLRPYGFGAQVMIDECPDGCGIWLDGGELETLEKHYEDQQSDSSIPLHWKLWAGVVGTLRRTKKK